MADVQPEAEAEMVPAAIAGTEPTPAAGGWRDRLAAMPAWGRALVLGGLGGILAVVILGGLSWSPWPDPGLGPGADDQRQAGGPATLPTAGAARATPAGGASGPPADGGEAPPGTAGAPGPPAQPAVPGQDPAPGAGGDPAPGGPVPPPAPELTAVMDTSTGLLGLGGRSVSVTVTNPGPDTAASWEVTMDVGEQEVTNVTGAGYERSGAVATFTPAAGGPAAGESLEFSFEIAGSLLGLGASDPTGCRIDGRACG